MSGHSKWATIKRKKEKTDVARAKSWNKLINEIVVAAQMSGGDPETNPRLRAAILKSKGQSLPAKNIESAIKKGIGDNDGKVMSELMYEGHGACATAFLVSVLTDNKTRSVADVRNAFSKTGGNMGEVGSVAWAFKHQGIIIVDGTVMEEDDMMELVLEAGADDFSAEEGVYEISTTPEDFMKVVKVLEENKIEMMSAELTYTPENTVDITAKDADKIQRLVDKLEDLDDVQDVYHNANFDDE